MNRNKHYMWQSVKGTTRIDIDETHKDKPIVVEPVEIFTIHSTYQELSRKDKKRMLSTLIRWSVREWLNNF